MNKIMTKETININEWKNEFFENRVLLDDEARKIAKELTDKGIVEIVELKNGLSIKTSSYVGCIQIGDLQINIHPKLNGMPLYKLLRYAYGLRDLKLLNMANHNIDEFSFFDLLIYELYVEANDLLRKGIQKSYIQKSENLTAPRGCINIRKLCSQGKSNQNSLPCKYFDRNEDNILNRIMLAGLKLGLKLVFNKSLKIKIQRLCNFMDDDISDIKLNRDTLKLAKNNINRLTGRYSSLIEIINILYQSQGIELNNKSDLVNLSGYFFDMNLFFEILVGRLIENCDEKYTVKNQFKLHGMFNYDLDFNDCKRKSPTSRPDFILMKQDEIVKIFDAKYRDLWERNLPSYMLYQLGIYALSSLGNNTSTIIYPCMNDKATIQKININNPISGTKMASVILKPLNLFELSKLVDGNKLELKKYVNGILGL